MAENNIDYVYDYVEAGIKGLEDLVDKTYTPKNRDPIHIAVNDKNDPILNVEIDVPDHGSLKPFAYQFASPEFIDVVIDELAEKVYADYESFANPGDRILLVNVLQGADTFYSHLFTRLREINATRDIEKQFSIEGSEIIATSYSSKAKSETLIQNLVYDDTRGHRVGTVEKNYDGHILLADGVLDTAETVYDIFKHLDNKEYDSIKSKRVSILFDKETDRREKVAEQYLKENNESNNGSIYQHAGMRIPDWWMVGFGPDWNLKSAHKGLDDFHFARKFTSAYVCDSDVTLKMINVYQGKDFEKASRLEGEIKYKASKFKTANGYSFLTDK